MRGLTCFVQTPGPKTDLLINRNTVAGWGTWPYKMMLFSAPGTWHRSLHLHRGWHYHVHFLNNEKSHYFPKVTALGIWIWSRVCVNPRVSFSVSSRVRVCVFWLYDLRNMLVSTRNRPLCESKSTLQKIGWQGKRPDSQQPTSGPQWAVPPPTLPALGQPRNPRLISPMLWASA